MQNNINLTFVIDGLKKLKSGKMVSISGNLLFTSGPTHIICWERGTDPTTQLFMIENSRIDEVISTLESKTFDQNL